jgi:CubicO group peptidase (beta-lactamase class C family)
MRVAALAVVENGVLVVDRRAETRVPWWSFTKTVIALAALAIVRDGRMGLDTVVPGRSYTLRQLLQHRAGLPDYSELGTYHEAVARDAEPWPVPVLLERVDAKRLRYPPGQGWRYSNVGYLFVADLIREATGDELATALDRVVLSPLGISRVRLARSRADLAGIALGETDSYHPGWVYHGLLVGPLKAAADLLHRAMTEDFLPPDLLCEMRRPHRLGGPVLGRPWTTPGYGLGLMTGGTRYGWQVEGHTGGGPGSVCAMYHCAVANPPRTAAAFTAGTSARLVETAAFRGACR